MRRGGQKLAWLFAEGVEDCGMVSHAMISKSRRLFVILFAVLAAPAVVSLAASKEEGKTASAPEQTGLRVMSYNIHHGRGMDEKVDLERIAD